MSRYYERLAILTEIIGRAKMAGLQNGCDIALADNIARGLWAKDYVIVPKAQLPPSLVAELHPVGPDQKE